MGVFRNFPYSNFHEMNMDEIIKIIKNMLEEWAQYHAEWDAWMAEINNDWSNYQEVMNEAWQNMQNFINNYFDNLDVQEEINNKIISMVNSGEFADIVEPYIPPRVTAWLNANITQPVGVVIDTSLTIAGACADAKATGDAIQDMNDNLTIIANNYGNIGIYRTHQNSAVDSSGNIISVSGYSIYDIPVNPNEVILISDSGNTKFYDNATLGNIFNFKKTDNTYQHIGTGFGTNSFVNTNYDDYMFLIPDNTTHLSITAKDDYYRNVVFYKNWTPADFSTAIITKKQLRSILYSDWVISSNLYMRDTDATFRALSTLAFTVPVKTGDMLMFDALFSPYTYYGTFWNASDGTVSKINVSTFTAPNNGIVFAFGDNTANILYLPVDEISLPAPANKILSNKKICVFGDSITEGNNLITGEINWPNLIVNELGGTLINCGVGSSRVAGHQSTAFHQDARLNTIKTANPDIVTILGGANDLIAEYPIGTEAQFDLPLANKDTDTFLGAYSYIIENLLTWKPSLQIVILGMYYALSDGTEYSSTLTYTMFSDATKKLAEHYCLPFVDLHSYSGFNQFTMGTSPYNIYTRDKIHPNQLGCNKIASIVIDELRKLFSI